MNHRIAMKRDLFYLLFAAGVLLHLAGCSEERGPRADSAATEPTAVQSKPEPSQKEDPEPAPAEPGNLSSAPVQATPPEEPGRATPETQNAARRAAMEKFEQTRKQAAPARPE